MHEVEWNTVMTAQASKPVFLNGKYPLEILNDTELNSKIASLSNTDFGLARAALEQAINPRYIASGNYNNEVHYETEDERAMKLWPKNKTAREAFKLGCKFPKEQSVKWEKSYDQIKRESAHKQAQDWAEQQEADIKMLEALTPDERMNILIDRAVRIAQWNQESAKQNNSGW